MMMVIGLSYAVIISPSDIQKVYYKEVLPGFAGNLVQMHRVFLSFQIASLLITLPVFVYGFIIVRSLYSRLIQAQLPWIENMYYRGFAKRMIYEILFSQLGIFCLIGGILGSFYGNVVYSLIIQDAINPLFLQLEVANRIAIILRSISLKNVWIGIGFSMLLSSSCIMPQILVIKKLTPSDDLIPDSKIETKSHRLSNYLQSNKFSLIVSVISLLSYIFLTMGSWIASLRIEILTEILYIFYLLARSLSFIIPFTFLWFGIYFLSNTLPKLVAILENWYLTKIAVKKKSHWRLQFIYNNDVMAARMQLPEQ